jgi:hypothetical protein
LSVYDSFTTGLFFIFLAWSEYLNVDKVYSTLSYAGDIALIIIVFELPPNAFYNILVRTDDLYGTNVFFPSALSASADITNPNVVNDKLI